MEYIHHGTQKGAEKPHGADHCGAGGGGAAGDVVLVVVVGGARSERSGREVGPDRGENAGERAARAASGGAGGGGAVVVVVLLLLLLLLLVRLGALFCLMPEEKKRRGDALVWRKRAFCIPFGPSSLSASLLCLMASLIVRKAHGGVWPAFWFARKVSEVWWRDVSALSFRSEEGTLGCEEGIWGRLSCHLGLEGGATGVWWRDVSAFPFGCEGIVLDGEECTWGHAFWFARNGSEVWWRDVSTLSLGCK